MKRKCIICCVGELFRKFESKYRLEFNIIGMYDKDKNKIYDNEIYVSLDTLNQLVYDCIVITSNKYKNEMLGELLNQGVDKSRVLLPEDMLWEKKNIDEIRYKVVKNIIEKIPEGLTLLDAGAGNQIYKKCCTHLRYISQDFGEFDYNLNKEGLHAEWHSQNCDIISDITDIPIESDSVDVVLCTEVFEHIINPIAAVDEFSRIIKPGGTLIITAPMYSHTHFAPYHYATGFNKYWYEKVLEKFGFDIDILEPYGGNYFDCLIEDIFMIEYAIDKYCKYSIVDFYSSIRKTIELLKECSKIDEGSYELLCAGWICKSTKR